MKIGANEIRNRMSSPWPDRLRNMQTNDTLLIESHDLTPSKVRIMARNFSMRQKGAIRFTVISDTNGDSLVTCVYRKPGADVSRKPPGFSNLRRREQAHTAVKRETLRPDPRETKVVRPVGDAPAIGFIEAIYFDGSHVLFHITDDAHHGVVLNRLMKELTVTSIQSFAGGRIIKRKTTWET